MPIAAINNISCYYEIHGEGRPLVLIGGLSGDSQTWKLVVNKLKQYFQVIIFDNRGVGRTQYPVGPFDISVLAKDTIALLDHLQIEKADILGHSMGGYVAQEIAIASPERVNNLILASTAAFTSARNKFLFVNMIKMLEKNISYDLFLREFMCWLFTPEYFNSKIKRSLFIKYVLSSPYRQTIEGFKKQVEAYARYSSYDRLDRIKAKTLIISGGRDLLITREDTESLALRIPEATVKCIENASDYCGWIPRTR